MQVVIDIPESAYIACKACLNIPNDETTLSDVISDAAGNGVVLQKGHGRLVGADAILSDAKRYFFDNTLALRCVEVAIESAQTVLEANQGALE